jgi:hypothetical protein
VAFALDLRFYALTSLQPSATAFGHPRTTFAIASIGVSVR